jgi:predicted RNase H-like nuclease (RuvC/YqgF family)
VSDRAPDTGFSNERTVYNYNRKVVTLEKRLKKIDDEIQEKEKLLFSSEVNKKQRAMLRSEIRQLDLEYRETVRDLDELRKIDPLS